MQDNQLFEYAVIRVVPAVEREEFLNVGVVLFCAKQKFLKMKYMLDEARIRNFSYKLDINEINCLSVAISSFNLVSISCWRSS